MNVGVLASRAKFLLNQNSSIILTGAGVAGTIGTAVLTGRASFKAARKLDQERIERIIGLHGGVPDSDKAFQFSRPDLVKLTWRYYISPVGVGILTVSSIIVAHRIDAKRIVALTVASGVSERAYKEYKDKVIEKLGERQETRVRDEIAQDRVNKIPGGELILVSDGKVLCMDGLTNRYFQSSPEELQKAVNKVNWNITHYDGASLQEFFDEIGLSESAYSISVGWNPDKLVELKISATLSEDNRPCLVVNYDPMPVPDFITVH